MNITRIFPLLVLLTLSCAQQGAIIFPDDDEEPDAEGAAHPPPTVVRAGPPHRGGRRVPPNAGRYPYVDSFLQALEPFFQLDVGEVPPNSFIGPDPGYNIHHHHHQDAHFFPPQQPPYPQPPFPSRPAKRPPQNNLVKFPTDAPPHAPPHARPPVQGPHRPHVKQPSKKPSSNIPPHLLGLTQEPFHYLNGPLLLVRFFFFMFIVMTNGFPIP